MSRLRVAAQHPARRGNGRGGSGRRAGRPSGFALARGAPCRLTTLLLNPRASGDPGWQLSFAAVIAILVFARPITGALPGVPRPVAEAAAVTASATLGTAPLIALHFDRLSLASVPANLLAAAAVAPVMWLGMLSALVGQFDPALATVLNSLCSYPLGFLSWVAHATARLPGAALPLRIGSPLALAFAYAALAAACAAMRSPRARGAAARAIPALSVATLAGVVALALVPGGGSARPPRGLRVSFLAVGQGDATLIQHGEHAILVDSGPPDGPVVALLERAGVRRLDALVVTHDQADHDGAAAAVLGRFAVGALLDGGEGPPSPQRRALLAAAARRNVPRIVPAAGETVRAGPLRLEVVWPGRDGPAPPPGTDPNRRALVIVAHDGAFDALLPADAETDVTGALDLPRVEVLKVAHHGSEDPGLPALLTSIRPQVAVIPVGPNSYGHPTPQAVAALRAAVPRVYRTDRDGTVRLDVQSDRIAVSTTG